MLLVSTPTVASLLLLSTKADIHITNSRTTEDRVDRGTAYRGVQPVPKAVAYITVAVAINTQIAVLC